MNDLPPDIQADLTALADGSLTPERREQVLAQVRDSAQLGAALAEQQRAVELVRSLSVEAPAALHRSVQELGAPRRRSAVLRPGFALATAAVVAALLISLSGLRGGGSRALTLHQVAALTLLPATMAAPAESPAHRDELAAVVESVPFPYWEARYGWHPSGERSDRLGGHSITTVFYSNDRGLRVGYSIVGGSPTPAHGGMIVRRGEVPYRLLAQSGAALVTWTRSGHTCVVSGRGVDARTLVQLASDGERSLT